jgi:transcriptional regulator with XRE-family HTH domain
MVNLKMTFSTQLKSEKERIGLTLADMSSVLDVAQRTVEHWLKGDRTPSVITQEGALARLKDFKENA